MAAAEAPMALGEPVTQTEALASLVLGERGDGLPCRVLRLGVVGPGLDARGPGSLEFAGGELAASHLAMRREEPLGVLYGGQLVRADGREHVGESTSAS
jgi:hypothetical protein